MADAVLGVIVGFVSGFLSGQFGIGGGLITTPAIRLLLGEPAIVAVATPLPVIIPTAIAGASSYVRSGLADVRSGLIVGAVGSVTSVFGALAVPLVGGDIVLLITALLIAYMAVDVLLLALRGETKGTQGRAEPYGEIEPAGPAEDGSPGGAAGLSVAGSGDAHPGREPSRPPRASGLAALGVVAGAYSGFLGLGGGFVVVPVLVRWFRFPMKRAIGTSLVAISLIAIPGTVTHWLLGDIDVALAALLIVGVVPGALLGAHVTRGARERSVRIGFAVLLFAAAAVLGMSELGLL